MNDVVSPLTDNDAKGFELRLVENLQPIRGFFFATSLFHLFDLGIADALRFVSPRRISDLADHLDLDPVRLEGLLLYLQVEGVVMVEDGHVRPLSKLSALREAWPWYEMLIGGYAQTCLEMGRGLRAGGAALSRNAERVGSGSCKISHYDAIPLTKALLASLRTAPKKIIDLGCGNALYLKELCALFPRLSAIGVEPNAGSHARSSADVLHSSQGPRMTLYNATAQEFVRNAYEADADAIIIAFVLQEILGQDGRAGAVNFLKETAAKFPDAHLVVIEVEDKGGDRDAMCHPLAKAYYNPYYLIHRFTDQFLANAGYWKELFAEAGYKVVAEATTDPEVDSTRFEVGFLLRRRVSSAPLRASGRETHALHPIL